MTGAVEPEQRVYKIEKQSYSRGAWRVLDANGEQVWRDELFDHPFLGETQIRGPVCFDRKRDAVAWVEVAVAVELAQLRAKVAALETLPQRMLNTIDPLGDGVDVRTHCVNLVRAALAGGPS